MERMLLTVLILTGLASCDGYTVNEFVVINDSDKRIVLDSELFTDNVDSSITVIPPKSEVLISFWSTLGGNSSPAMESLVETSDSLFLASTLISSDGDTLYKPFHNIRAWEIFSKQLHKFPSSWKHAHRFTIDNNDWE